MPPSWLHKNISREEAESRVKAVSEDNGTFLVRQDKGKQILVVMYKGKATHHLIEKNDAGLYTVNKKAYGDADTITKLINTLKGSVPGWPVPLKKFPSNPDSSGGGDDKPKKKKKKASSGGGDSYVHGAMKKEEAEEALASMGNESGNFLVRGPESKRVLSVIYKGRPTHHLISEGEDGNLLVNKKSYGAVKKLSDLINLLKSGSAKGWPVPLTAHYAKPGSEKSEATEKPKKAGTKPAAAADDSGSGPAVSGTPWLHESLNKASSEELMQSFGLEDGNFLVRGPESKQVLTVVYKGQPTHHLVKANEEGKLLVNNKAYVDASSLEELIKLLSNADSKGKWPVVLKRYPPNESAGTKEAEEPKPVEAQEPEPQEQNPPPEEEVPPEIPQRSVQVVELPTPLGMKFTGSPTQGIFVSFVKEGGNVDKDGRIAVGDLVVSVNGQSTAGLKKEEVTAYVKESGSSVSLAFKKDPAAYAAFTGEGSSAEADASSAPTATIESIIAEKQWLHGERSEEDITALFVDAQMRDGLFLIRQKEDFFVLDLVLNQQVTHHMLRQDPQTRNFTVNNQDFGFGEFITDVVTGLAQIREDWPCPLTLFVPVDRNVGDVDKPASLPLNPTQPVTTARESIAAAGTATTMDQMKVNDTFKVAEPTTWKCGVCGTINPETQSDGPRVCMSCGEERAARRASNDQTDEQPEPARSGSADPALEEARQNLHQAVQVLSAYRQQKLYEVLAKFVNRKWPLATMVTGLATVLGKLETRQRENIEFCVGKLIPKSVREEYYVLLERVYKEAEIAEVIAEVSHDQQAYLVRYVMQSLQSLRGDTRTMEQVSTFERRIHHISTLRGWAQVVLQGRSQDENFDVEKVAKQVHIGWARAIVTEWDPAYGVEPIGNLVIRDDGLMDTYNFATNQGYRVYRERVELAKQRYLLPGETTKDVSPGTPILPNMQKHNYRAVAEVLIHAYLIQHPADAYLRVIDRVDDFVAVELKQLGAIRPPPKYEEKPLTDLQKSMLHIPRGQLSLTGRVTGIVTPQISLPTALEQATDLSTAEIVVSMPTPTGITLSGTAELGFFVDAVEDGSHAAASGMIRPGMRIIRVQDTSVDGLDQAAVEDLFAQVTDGDITLILVRDKAALAAYRAHGRGDQLMQPPAYESDVPQPEHEEFKRSVWFHGELDKETTSAVISQHPDGTFLVRQRVNKEEFALAVVHQGQVTHHIISRVPDGRLVVGDLDLGDVISLPELVDALRLPRDDWQQQLIGFFPRPGATPDEINEENLYVEELLQDKECGQCGETKEAKEGSWDRSDGYWYCFTCWQVFEAVEEEARRKAEEEESRRKAEEEEERYRQEQEARRANQPVYYSEPSTGGNSQYYQELDGRPVSLAGDEIDWEKARSQDMKHGVVDHVNIAKRETGGFGLLLKGPKTEEDIAKKPGIYVKSVKEGSPAAASGKLVPGVKILALNGTRVETATKSQCTDILRNENEIDVEFVVFTSNAPIYESGGGQELYGVARGFGSAASSTFDVNIEKPFGLVFDDELKVKKVKEGGNAAATGQVKPGLQIIRVNDTAVVGMSKPEVTQLIKSQEGLIKMTFGATMMAAQSAPATVTVDLNKPFGIVFNENLAIKKIKPEGNAEASGKLAVGMTLVSVNGQSTVGMSKAEGTELIKSASGTVRIELSTGAPSQAAPVPVKTDFSVTVGKPLGMTFTDEMLVKSVKEGGNAQQTGKIKPGLKIEAVNGTTTKGKTKPEVTALFKAAQGELTVTFSDPSAPTPAPQAMAQPLSAPPETTGGGHEQTFKVQLPMGMSLDGDNKTGIFISKVKPGGNAEKSNVVVGLKLKVVNGNNVGGMKKKEVTEIIKAATGSVTIVCVEDHAGFQTVIERREEKYGSATSPTSPRPPSATPSEAPSEASTIASSKAKAKKVNKKDVGKRCTVEGYDGVKGTIRFFGPLVSDEAKKRVGVELDTAVGKNNGKFQGHQYFTCAAKHGVMVAASKVSILEGEGAPPPQAPSAPAPVAAADTTSSSDGEVSVDVATPLGMSFEGLAEYGAFVTKVKPGSNAEASGVIQPKMRILKINDTSVSGMGKKQIVKLVKDSGERVALTLVMDVEGQQRFQAAQEQAKQEKVASDSRASSPTSPQPTYDNGEAGPATTSPGGDDQYSTMGRLALIKILRTRQVDYGGTKDVEKLRELARATDDGTVVGGGGGGTAAPEPASPVPAPAPAPTQATPAIGGGEDYDSMGRLALIKVLRGRGVDYSSVAKDVDALRQLAKSSEGSGGGGDTASPAPAPVQPTESTPAPSAGGGGDDPYEGMGRLQLIKECRGRGLDYSQVAKDVAALKALLRSSDGN